MSRKNPFFEADPSSYSLNKEKCGRFELEYYLFNSSKPPIISVWDSELEAYNNIGLVYYMNDVSDLEEDIIETIEEVMERGWGSEIIGNNFTLVSVIVEPQVCYVTSNNDLVQGKEEAALDSSMHITTSDFLQFSLKWRDFLKKLK